jgi:tryptophan synthase alpha subunit
VASPAFTQEQVDKLAAKYAEGVVSGSITVEGRTRSFNYGSLDHMWTAIQKMQQSVNSSMPSAVRPRFTYATHNSGK